MTKVKICGITNVEDAMIAVEAGADFIGVIQVPNTPRYVLDPTTIASIRSVLPPHVPIVGVFADAVDIEPTGSIGRFDLFQIYSDSRNHSDSRIDLKLIRCCRVQDEASLRNIEVFGAKVQYILLDAYHDKSLGGTGAAFDWNIARTAVDRFDRPVILAGGLNPTNVASAIQTAKPFAVDVSSGVEEFPGRKDRAKVVEFVSNAKSA